MSSTSNTTLSIGMKNEADLERQVGTLAEDLHSKMDGIFAGIIEPGRPTNHSLLITSDPIEALESSLEKVRTLLKAATSLGFRLNSDALATAIARPLYIQNDTPTKDIRTRTLKGSLPMLHSWSWKTLAWLGKAIDLTLPLGPVLKLFLTRYHLKMEEGEGLAVLTALLEYLATMAIWQPSLHGHQVNPLSRALVEHVLNILKRLSQSTATEKEIVTHVSKKARINSKTLTANSKEASETTKEGWRAKSMALQWLEAALNIPSFQMLLSDSHRSLLFTHILFFMEGPACLPAFRSLFGLAVNQQPARLSPQLPLLLRIISGTLKHPNGEMRTEAHRMACAIDFLIRPRRPYTPKAMHQRPSPPIITDEEPSTTFRTPKIEPTSPNPPSSDTTDFTTSALSLSIEETVEDPSAKETEMPLSQSITSAASELNNLLHKETITFREMAHMEIDLGEDDSDEPLPKLVDEGPDE